MRRLILPALLLCGTANAAVVTIDAQSYPTGTDISSVGPGVTLTEVTNWGVISTYTTRPIVAIPNSWVTGIGPNLFGHNPSKPTVSHYDFRNLNGAFSCLSGGFCTNAEFYNPIRARFDVPTNRVEIRAHFLKEAIDGADLRAYNAQNELIVRCHIYGDQPKQPIYTFPVSLNGTACGRIERRYECSSSGANCKTDVAVVITRSYPDIAYVLYGGESASATGASLSRIRYRRFSEDCAP